jgi:hypothetical protein
MTLAAAIVVLPLMPAVPVAANPALEGYADYPALKAQIDELAKSDVVTASSLGTTLGGRDVYLLTIGTGPTEKKPAFWIVGNVHEPHVVGSELAMRLAQQLARSDAQDDPIRGLIEQYTFYIIPRPNPDGTERLWDQPWRDRAGNDRRTDDDRDFQFGEDPPNDLNGDGWITMMRVHDETGTYMAHPDDERILIQADAKKNERGQYRLYSEGADEDEDEQWNEDASDGVSVNRNFTFRYPYFEKGAGPNQVSERNSRYLADFAFDHPNISVVFVFTPEDNLMKAWKSSPSGQRQRIPTEVLSDDAPYFRFLSDRYREIHQGADAPGSARGAGSFSEWAYYHYGRWSLAARAWWPPKSSESPTDEADKREKEETDEKPDKEADKRGGQKGGKKPDDDDRGADDLVAIRWLDREGIDGFVDWSPIDHPDFPNQKVEVGGFKPLYRLNPPARKLDELAEKHLRFLRELASLMPSVQIHSTEIEALGGGVFRIQAEVANVGYLPTCSQMGSRSRQVNPLQIVLQLPDQVELIQGPARQRLAPLAGNGGRSKQTWVVRVPGELPVTGSLRVWAPAVGAVEKAIELRADANRTE